MPLTNALRAGGATLAALICFALCQPVLAQDSEVGCAKINNAQTPIYKAPNASSKVLDKLKAGTLLRVSAAMPATGQAAWYEFYQYDKGDGFIYAYLAYNLPGTNPFVRAQDVTVLPYEVCFPQ